MSPECRASVIVPCLDERDEIRRSSSSIVRAVEELADTNVEIVYVDGGSVDGTVDAIYNVFRDHEVHVIEQLQPGIGHARELGARYAIDRASRRKNRATDDFWIISTDADTIVPDSWLTDWIKSFDAEGSSALAGSGRFPDWFADKYPNVHTSLEVVNNRLAEAIKIFGPINLDGTNNAIELEVYNKIGPFQQPARFRNGRTVNLAGEDWDMGTRARLLDIAVVTHPGIPVVISPRRFEADITAFLSGEAYEKEFLRVDRNPSQTDISEDEIDRTTKIVTVRQVMHWIEKPILVNPELLTEPEPLAFLGHELASEMQNWISRTERPDVFTHRNGFILDYLGAFHVEFGSDLSKRFEQG